MSTATGLGIAGGSLGLLGLLALLSKYYGSGNENSSAESFDSGYGGIPEPQKVSSSNIPETVGPTRPYDAKKSSSSKKSGSSPQYDHIANAPQYDHIANAPQYDHIANAPRYDHIANALLYDYIANALKK